MNKIFKNAVMLNLFQRLVNFVTLKYVQFDSESNKIFFNLLANFIFTDFNIPLL